MPDDRKPRLAPDWRYRLRRYWSLRIVIFWGGLSGLASVWGSFDQAMPLWLFALLSFGINAAVAAAVLTKQPGAKE